MADNQIDDFLRDAAAAPHEVDPALLARISGSITAGLRPVRPLPRAWILVVGLCAVCAVVALAGALRLGFFGIRRLTALDIAVIFPALCAFVWTAATLSVAQMTPGSRRRVSAPALLAIGSLGLVAVFALLFHDYRTDRFVGRGLACLVAGLVAAVPAGVAGWLLLRRGHAVNPAAAGLAAGTFASLAGVIMLELHCPNLEAPHVMLWHTAVIPISALAGAVLARLRSSH